MTPQRDMFLHISCFEDFFHFCLFVCVCYYDVVVLAASLLDYTPAMWLGSKVAHNHSLWI